MVYLIREKNGKENWGPKVFSPDSPNCYLPNLKSKWRGKKIPLGDTKLPCATNVHSYFVQFFFFFFQTLSSQLSYFFRSFFSFLFFFFWVHFSPVFPFICCFFFFQSFFFLIYFRFLYSLSLSLSLSLNEVHSIFLIKV